VRHVVHPDDDAYDERRSHQHQHAFKSVFANLELLKADSRADTGENSEENPNPGIAFQGATAAAVQIDQHDADDKRGFHAFAKSD
jgi:hypothetical protein